MVLLDQEPLRESVADDCTRAMARLDEARSGWHRFERKDKPAFARWRAREFGALLSRAREVEVQISAAQMLVHEVEMEMRRVFQDAPSAYQRVMFRRAHPAEAAEEDKEFSPGKRGTGRKVSDFEKEALFQEWVKSSLGTNPDKMDDEAYSTSFEAFKSHMFRAAPEEPPSPNRQARRPSRRSAAEQEEKEDEIVALDRRVRELYRRLVRRLHPDLRADGSTVVSALWHEVQEAYVASDVARMEILLALSDIEANRSADQTLAQLHAVRIELQRALRALEKSLLEAEGEDAWDFARTGPNADLRIRVERQLKTDLAARSQRLDLFTRTIAEWAQGPMSNRKARPANPVNRTAWS
ncbi:MAG: hypothetical protein ACMG5Z_07240 [Luteimonas sp.]